MGTFSERLRASMDSANMKAVELHERTGISKASISEYLSGNYEPKQRNIFKIAQALNVSPSYLMGVNDDPRSPVQPPAPTPASSDLPDVSPTGQKIDARTRRQLEKVLDDDNLTYNGVVLNGEDKEKVKKALELIFWDVKEKNKRKK